jgi:hypothetical protein
MQAGGNLITDGNDNLIITATVFSAQDYWKKLYNEIYI